MTAPESAILHVVVGIAAFLYASVGHGGASAYLAALALLSVPRETAVPTALLLNILVSAASFAEFRRARHFSWDFTWPFVIASVPAAYLGGLLRITSSWYHGLLALALALAAFRMWAEIAPQPLPEASSRPPLRLSLLLGAGIGVLSGMIGIGGGVFLSPVCLLLRWADPHRTAATAACFILLNSAAGLAGRLGSGVGLAAAPGLSLVLVACCAGWMGARLGASWSGLTLRRVLGAVLGMASLKLLHAAL